MKIFRNTDIENHIQESDFREAYFNEIIFDDTESFTFGIERPSYHFYKCHFKSKRADFSLVKLDKERGFASIFFNECVFDSDIFIAFSDLNKLIIHDCQINSEIFTLNNVKTEELVITNKSKSKKQICRIDFDNNCEIDYFDIRLITIIESLRITDTTIKRFEGSCNKINKFVLENINLENDFSMRSSQFVGDCIIKDSNFKKVNFYQCKSQDTLYFENLYFERYADFSHFQSLRCGALEFSKISFNGQVSFDKSNLYLVKFDSVFFKDITSFQKIDCDRIFFNRVHFDKIAFFNDIKINLKHSLDINTVRVIKNQLYKADNRIDYIEFKRLELNYFYNLVSENKWKNWNSFKDYFILSLHNTSSKNGTDWLRAAIFTLSSGFLFYVLFFLSQNYSKEIDFGNSTAFFTSFFRFLLVTDFHNPLSEEKAFIDNVIGWILFIFGKIFVGFGIYEIIQSFRKFRL